jgi:tetratricopeptide (TPR) repeat protein
VAGKKSAMTQPTQPAKKQPAPPVPPVDDGAAYHSKRTPRVIGRQEELQRIEQCLQARGESNILYYYGPGGLGKTRLLEDVERKVALLAGNGEDYFCTSIIDLYHTDTHATSDLEHLIVEGLDREGRFFKEYREARGKYELLRERGSDPSQLEERRANLSNLFVRGERDLAVEARKLVILFDTVELLQHESSIVERTAGLEDVNARIKPWLLTTLPDLRNVLVIFAGRPKMAVGSEQGDPQAELINDFREAFGARFEPKELEPLTKDDIKAFVEALSGEGVKPGAVLPVQYLDITHRLTGGRPVFLHLLIDLILYLHPQPKLILEMLGKYQHLADQETVPDNDPRLEEAQTAIEREIMEAVFFKSPLGGYLGRIAMMPKGVNAEILNCAIGLPRDEAEALLVELEPLSFVKNYKRLTPPGSPSAQHLPHEQRVFLHDEMYRLLRQYRVLAEPEINEITVANGLIRNYYEPEIQALERKLKVQRNAEGRIPIRRDLQKLQVEQLYYRLVQDPRQGYREYRRLANEANRLQAVGHAMRLLDEFLRFYNTPDRRVAFDKKGLSENRLTRESVQMWVERFHWWAMYDKELDFARKVLENPPTFCIDPARDCAILGNIIGLMVRARAMKYGFEQDAVDQALAMLNCLPPLDRCNDDETLARARLATSIGYEYRQKREFDLAVRHYRQANAAFRKLQGYPDELAIALNNLAFAYNQQGRFPLAVPLGLEALRINEDIGSEYGMGLNLYTLGRIETKRGNYGKAIQYCDDSLKRFQGLEDSYGTAIAYLAQGEAQRKRAKEQLQEGYDRATARADLQAARESLEKGLQEAESAKLESTKPELLAEMAKVYRELGRLDRLEGGLEKGSLSFRQSERYFELALKPKNQGEFFQADTLEDWGEELYDAGDWEEADNQLKKVERLVPDEYKIVKGIDQKQPGRTTQYFWPLGKVERLRAERAFDGRESEEALRHALRAYTYFNRFSAEAPEKDTTIRITYEKMRDLPGPEQERLLRELDEWAKGYGDQLEKDAFIDTLGGLLGA